MLNQHRNLVVPQSDYLRVGGCVVDIPRREVSSPQRPEPVRISLKALQVLLVLVSHHGKVVGREALLEWVWPDTLPTDDVLTQAITQLRKAFCDDRDAPQYLETIAKGGYRLLAPIQWGAADAPAQDEVAVPPQEAVATAAAIKPQRSFGPIIIAGALMATAVIAFSAVQVSTRFLGGDNPVSSAATAARMQPVAPLAYETITSRPGRETSPNLSPDGSMVAYSDQPQDASESAIMVQTTAQTAPRRLTTPEAGSSDLFPVWSHDGRRLAFVRVSSKNCQIMLIAASGGGERKAADCHGDMFGLYDWTPDDRGLLMGGTRNSNETYSPLRLLDLSTGRWRALRYPVSAGDTDVNPHYSPDGRWIVFRRNVSLSDLWKMPAGGGPLQRLTRLRGDIRGWDWLPDGSGLVFCLIASEVGLYRYHMDDGAIEKLDVLGTFTMPDVAAWSASVVGELDQFRSGIFRHPLGAAATPAKREQLFASSGGDLLPSLSPDGRTLAFLSDRSMQTQLWLGVIDRPETLRPVKDLIPIPRHAAVWSQDGSRMLVIGSREDKQQLYEVDVGSDVFRRLPVPEGNPVYAAYTSQPDRLLVGTDGGAGRLRLGLYDISKPVWQRLATIDDVSLAKFDHRRQRIYFTRASRAGIWSSDPQLRGIQLVNEYYPRPRMYREWAIAGDGVRLLIEEAQCRTAWRSLEDESAATPCLRLTGSGMPSSPSLDPQGRSIVTAMPISDNVDIGWLVLPEAARAKTSAPAPAAADAGSKD